MNGGIQDAYYLAWKLAGALQGGESVLFTESLLPGTTFLLFQIAA
jgi:2-polyprenyl-6-methoxyphenol hydroxylase-like FAD-dependent oxidoreductase